VYSGKTVQRVNNKNTLSQFLIKILNLCLEGLLNGFLCESAHHLSLREIVIHRNGSVDP
jgi:hypothetical protein